MSSCIGESLFAKGSHYLLANNDWGSHYLPANNDWGVIILGESLFAVTPESNNPRKTIFTMA